MNGYTQLIKAVAAVRDAGGLPGAPPGPESNKDAKAAAHAVQASVPSATFEGCVGDAAPPDLATRRDERRVPDDLDAERWLDEGGSFS